MEDYEERYNKLVNFIKDLYPHTSDYVKEKLEGFIPELKESEDERIRKAQLDYWRSVGGKEWYGVPVQETIAWLEKQGEQKPTDKVEPKFKVGDWITNGEYTWLIEGIHNSFYYIVSLEGCKTDDTISHVDEYFHLWTIADAKYGDVLATDNSDICLFDGTVEEGIYPFAYCGLTRHHGFEVYDRKLPFTHNNNVYPATKKQCDLLFQKMKEAGYEWNSKKKELKKIEQKSSWSEEDEKHISWLIEHLNQGVGIYDDLINWLKSIKPNHWKPSEEQMKSIKYFIDFNRPQANASTEGWSEFKHLESLYNDLLKL